MIINDIWCNYSNAPVYNSVKTLDSDLNKHLLLHTASPSPWSCPDTASTAASYRQLLTLLMVVADFTETDVCNNNDDEENNDNDDDNNKSTGRFLEWPE